jgi:hypothetical protein
MYYFTDIFIWLLVLLLIVKTDKATRLPLLIIFICITRSLLQFLSYASIGVISNYVDSTRKIGSVYLSQMFFNNCVNLTHNFQMIPNHNTIFLANYPTTVVEYICFKLLPLDVAIVVANGFIGSWTLCFCKTGQFIKLKGGKNNFESLLDDIKEKIKHMSIFVYIEDQTRKKKISGDSIAYPLRKGIFDIAYQLGITITPLFIDRVKMRNGLIDKRPFRMLLGETMEVTNPKDTAIQTYKFLNSILKQRRNG